MRNRNMFRCEGRGMGQRCGMGRRFAMNQTEVVFADMSERNDMGRREGFVGRGQGRGKGFEGQGRGRMQGFGRGTRCR